MPQLAIGVGPSRFPCVHPHCHRLSRANVGPVVGPAAALSGREGWVFSPVPRRPVLTVCRRPTVRVVDGERDDQAPPATSADAPGSLTPLAGDPAGDPAGGVSDLYLAAGPLNSEWLPRRSAAAVGFFAG